MNMSGIMRRTSVGVAAVGAACAIGLATAPAASAAPVQPVQAVGSVAICFGIPIGPVTISVCL
ncbi:hypothetical protein P9A14_20910 [Gordonia hongkongensis]|uniref:Uncharacterized protein n=1 Tax=Gordonia hongkongensis TaxID=1701090 RepID=A0AAX3T5X0_9ACTN|nr:MULTISPECIES: hypothetical protein [Gordonia]MBR7193636.1 hypothetical protein [Gordonia sp. SCSIO 19800]QIK46454.1 hypothetical protein G8C36_03865 [Gordonia terrae]WFP24555.1 hypothetical protein P9A14_20910 [Gordonia hongkongensis]WGJ85249.1 hypothetical protein QAD21_21530 [Gordonia sp. SMJS1]